MNKLAYALLLSLAVASLARSQETKLVNKDFAARLDRLEAENRELRQELKTLTDNAQLSGPQYDFVAPVRLANPSDSKLHGTEDNADKFAELQSAQQQMAGGLSKLQKGLENVGQNLKITTVDKAWGIGVFGSLNTEALYADARPLTPSAPLFILPDFGRDTKTFNVHAHSTNFGIALQGPKVGDLKAGGLFLAYLWGEQFEADRYGIFIARSYGELKNENVRYALGLESDVMNPLSPTMINFNSGQLGGNFGFFRAQMRRERYYHLADEAQLTTQFAICDPVTTSFADFTLPPNRLLEDAGWPLLQGRIALGLGPNSGPPGQQTRPFEVGISGVIGELRRTDFPGPNREFEVWAFGADARWKWTDFLGVKGEFFHGQAIGNFNAAILQVNNDLLDPVRATGGWGEIYLYWFDSLHSHFGFGIDDPLDSDLLQGLATARPNRNQFAFGNVIWDVTKNFEIGFEVSHFETSYLDIAPLDIDNSSWVYHSRIRLKF